MANKEVKELIRKLRAQGFEVQTKGANHPKVYKDGRFVGVLPSTPSDWRSLRNTIKELERQGFKP